MDIAPLLQLEFVYLSIAVAPVEHGSIKQAHFVAGLTIFGVVHTDTSGFSDPGTALGKASHHHMERSIGLVFVT